MDGLRSARYEILRKAVTLAVAAAFFLNYVLMDAWAALEPAKVPYAAAQAPKSMQSALDIDTFSIPDNFGDIKSKFKGSSRKVIIHLQDAHCDPAAQHRIAELIEYLNKEYGVRALNIEGASGPFDLTVFTSISGAEIRREVADYFVDKGEINGAEFYAINNPESVELWGIEDKQLYLDNLRVYRESLKNREAVEKYLGQLGGALDALKKKIYTPDLLKTDEMYASYKSGAVDFKAYVGFLSGKAAELGIDTKKYDSIRVLLETMRSEKDIDFKQANRDRDALVGEISKWLSLNERKEFLSRSLEFKTKRISQKTFYSYLSAKAAGLNISMEKYRNLAKYTEYISAYESLDLDAVMADMAGIEADVRTKLCRTDDEKRLYLLSYDLAILRNIFSITLTRQDYMYYLENKDAFAVQNYMDFILSKSSANGAKPDIDPDVYALDRYREEIAAFYDYSLKRDDAFVKNMRFAKTPADGESAIIMTGGFHAENLCEILKKEGISYISIIPRFTIEKDKINPYFGLLAGGSSEVEDMLRSVLAKAGNLQIASHLSLALGDAVWGEAGMYVFKAAVRIQAMNRGNKTVEIVDENGETVIAGDKPLVFRGQRETAVEKMTIAQLLESVGYEGVGRRAEGVGGEAQGEESQVSSLESRGQKTEGEGPLKPAVTKWMKKIMEGKPEWLTALVVAPPVEQIVYPGGALAITLLFYLPHILIFGGFNWQMILILSTIPQLWVGYKFMQAHYGGEKGRDLVLTMLAPGAVTLINSVILPLTMTDPVAYMFLAYGLHLAINAIVFGANILMEKTGIGVKLGLADRVSADRRKAEPLAVVAPEAVQPEEVSAVIAEIETPGEKGPVGTAQTGWLYGAKNMRNWLRELVIVPLFAAILAVSVYFSVAGSRLVTAKPMIEGVKALPGVEAAPSVREIFSNTDIRKLERVYREGSGRRYAGEEKGHAARAAGLLFNIASAQYRKLRLADYSPDPDAETTVMKAMTLDPARIGKINVTKQGNWIFRGRVEFEEEVVTRGSMDVRVTPGLIDALDDLIASGMLDGYYKFGEGGTAAPHRRYDSISLYFFSPPSEELLNKLSRISESESYKRGEGGNLTGKSLTPWFYMSEIGSITEEHVRGLMRILVEDIDGEGYLYEKISTFARDNLLEELEMSEGQFVALKFALNAAGLDISYDRAAGFTVSALRAEGAGTAVTNWIYRNTKNMPPALRNLVVAPVLEEGAYRAIPLVLTALLFVIITGASDWGLILILMVPLQLISGLKFVKDHYSGERSPPAILKKLFVPSLVAVFNGIVLPMLMANSLLPVLVAFSPAADYMIYAIVGHALANLVVLGVNRLFPSLKLGAATLSPKQKPVDPEAADIIDRHLASIYESGRSMNTFNTRKYWSDVFAAEGRLDLYREAGPLIEHVVSEGLKAYGSGELIDGNDLRRTLISAMIDASIAYPKAAARAAPGALDDERGRAEFIQYVDRFKKGNVVFDLFMSGGTAAAQLGFGDRFAALYDELRKRVTERINEDPRRFYAADDVKLMMDAMVSEVSAPAPAMRPVQSILVNLFSGRLEPLNWVLRVAFIGATIIHEMGHFAGDQYHLRSLGRNVEKFNVGKFLGGLVKGEMKVSEVNTSVAEGGPMFNLIAAVATGGVLGILTLRLVLEGNITSSFIYFLSLYLFISNLAMFLAEVIAVRFGRGDFLLTNIEKGGFNVVEHVKGLMALAEENPRLKSAVYPIVADLRRIKDDEFRTKAAEAALATVKALAEAGFDAKQIYLMVHDALGHDEYYGHTLDLSSLGSALVVQELKELTQELKDSLNMDREGINGIVRSVADSSSVRRSSMGIKGQFAALVGLIDGYMIGELYTVKSRVVRAVLEGVVAGADMNNMFTFINGGGSSKLGAVTNVLSEAFAARGINPAISERLLKAILNEALKSENPAVAMDNILKTNAAPALAVLVGKFKWGLAARIFGDINVRMKFVERAALSSDPSAAATAFGRFLDARKASRASEDIEYISLERLIKDPDPVTTADLAAKAFSDLKSHGIRGRKADIMVQTLIDSEDKNAAAAAFADKDVFLSLAELDRRLRQLAYADKRVDEMYFLYMVEPIQLAVLASGDVPAKLRLLLEGGVLEKLFALHNVCADLGMRHKEAAALIESAIKATDMIAAFEELTGVFEGLKIVTSGKPDTKLLARLAKAVAGSKNVRDIAKALRKSFVLDGIVQTYPQLSVLSDEAFGLMVRHAAGEAKNISRIVSRMYIGVVSSGHSADVEAITSAIVENLAASDDPAGNIEKFLTGGAAATPAEKLMAHDGPDKVKELYKLALGKPGPGIEVAEEMANREMARDTVLAIVKPSGGLAERVKAFRDLADLLGKNWNTQLVNEMLSRVAAMPNAAAAAEKMAARANFMEVMPTVAKMAECRIVKNPNVVGQSLTLRDVAALGVLEAMAECDTEEKLSAIDNAVFGSGGYFSLAQAASAVTNMDFDREGERVAGSMEWEKGVDFFRALAGRPESFKATSEALIRLRDKMGLGTAQTMSSDKDDAVSWKVIGNIVLGSKDPLRAVNAFADLLDSGLKKYLSDNADDILILLAAHGEGMAEQAELLKGVLEKSIEAWPEIRPNSPSSQAYLYSMLKAGLSGEDPSVKIKALSAGRTVEKVAEFVMSLPPLPSSETRDLETVLNSVLKASGGPDVLLGLCKEFVEACKTGLPDQAKNANPAILSVLAERMEMDFISPEEGMKEISRPEFMTPFSELVGYAQALGGLKTTFSAVGRNKDPVRAAAAYNRLIKIFLNIGFDKARAGKYFENVSNMQDDVDMVDATVAFYDMLAAEGISPGQTAMIMEKLSITIERQADDKVIAAGALNALTQGGRSFAETLREQGTEPERVPMVAGTLILGLVGSPDPYLLWSRSFDRRNIEQMAFLTSGRKEFVDTHELSALLAKFVQKYGDSGTAAIFQIADGMRTLSETKGVPADFNPKKFMDEMFIPRMPSELRDVGTIFRSLEEALAAGIPFKRLMQFLQSKDPARTLDVMLLDLNHAPVFDHINLFLKSLTDREKKNFIDVIIPQVAGDKGIDSNNNVSHAQLWQTIQVLSNIRGEGRDWKERLMKSPIKDRIFLDLRKELLEEGKCFENWKQFQRLRVLANMMAHEDLLKAIARYQDGTPEGETLYAYYRFLIFHSSMSDYDALRAMVLDPAKFLEIQDSHTPTELHDAKKPSRFLSLDHVDISARELVDGLILGKFNDLQAVEAFSMTLGMEDLDGRLSDLKGADLLRYLIDSKYSGSDELKEVLKAHFGKISDALKDNNDPKRQGLKQAVSNTLEALEVENVSMETILSKLQKARFGIKELRAAGLDLPTYTVRIIPKSDPQAIMTGSEAPSCMYFGSGKNNVYMFNMNTAFLALSKEVTGEDGKKRGRIIATSVLTMDRKVPVLASELREAVRRAAESNTLTDLSMEKLLGPDFIDKVSQEVYLGADNVEAAPNVLSSAEADSFSDKVRIAYKRFFEEYLKKYPATRRGRAIADTKVLVGQQYSKALTDLPDKEANYYVMQAPVGYSDKMASSTVLVLPLDRPAEPPRAPPVLTGVMPLSYEDTLEVAYIENKAFEGRAYKNHIAGIEMELMGAAYNEALKGDLRKHLSLGYFVDGKLQGYIIAYVGLDRKTNEEIIYISDFAVLKKGSMAAAKLLDGLFTNVQDVAKTFRDKYGKNIQVLLQATTAEDGSYRLFMPLADDVDAKKAQKEARLAKYGLSVDGQPKDLGDGRSEMRLNVNVLAPKAETPAPEAARAPSAGVEAGHARPVQSLIVNIFAMLSDVQRIPYAFRVGFSKLNWAMRVAGFISLSTQVHEIAHAAVARLLGATTGRVLSGLATGEIDVKTGEMKRPSAPKIYAIYLAGMIANLTLAGALGAYLFYAGQSMSSISYLLIAFITVFNLASGMAELIAFPFGKGDLAEAMRAAAEVPAAPLWGLRKAALPLVMAAVMTLTALVPATSAAAMQYSTILVSVMAAAPAAAEAVLPPERWNADTRVDRGIKGAQVDAKTGDLVLSVGLSAADSKGESYIDLPGANIPGLSPGIAALFDLGQGRKIVVELEIPSSLAGESNGLQIFLKTPQGNCYGPWNKITSTNTGRIIRIEFDPSADNPGYADGLWKTDPKKALTMVRTIGIKLSGTGAGEVRVKSVKVVSGAVAPTKVAVTAAAIAAGEVNKNSGVAPSWDDSRDISYGFAFGEGDNAMRVSLGGRSNLEQFFAELERAGATSTRVFIRCDNRNSWAGVQEDLNALLDIAKRHNIRPILTLYDVTIIDNAEEWAGITSNSATELNKVKDIVEGVDEYLALKNDAGRVLAWDVMNEPDQRGTADVVKFVKELARAVKSTGTTVPVTVGITSRNTDAIKIFVDALGTDLDMIELHWYPDYPALPSRDALVKSFPQIGSRPVIIGEFGYNQAAIGKSFADTLNDIAAKGYDRVIFWQGEWQKGKPVSVDLGAYKDWSGKAATAIGRRNAGLIERSLMRWTFVVGLVIFGALMAPLAYRMTAQRYSPPANIAVTREIPAQDAAERIVARLGDLKLTRFQAPQAAVFEERAFEELVRGILAKLGKTGPGIPSATETPEAEQPGDDMAREPLPNGGRGVKHMIDAEHGNYTVSERIPGGEREWGYEEGSLKQIVERVNGEVISSVRYDGQGNISTYSYDVGDGVAIQEDYNDGMLNVIKARSKDDEKESRVVYDSSGMALSQMTRMLDENGEYEQSEFTEYRGGVPFRTTTYDADNRVVSRDIFNDQGERAHTWTYGPDGVFDEGGKPVENVEEYRLSEAGEGASAINLEIGPGYIAVGVLGENGRWVVYDEQTGVLSDQGVDQMFSSARRICSPTDSDYQYRLGKFTEMLMWSGTEDGARMADFVSAQAFERGFLTAAPAEVQAQAQSLMVNLLSGRAPVTNTLIRIWGIVSTPAHELLHYVAALMFGANPKLSVSGLFTGEIKIDRAPPSKAKTYLIYSAGLLANLALAGASAYYLFNYGQTTSLLAYALLVWIATANAASALTELIGAPFGKGDLAEAMKAAEELKPIVPEAQTGITRREFLAKSGAAAVVGAAVVLLPGAAEAARPAVLEPPATGVPVPAGAVINAKDVPMSEADNIARSLSYVKGLTPEKVRAAIALSNSDEYRRFAAAAYDRLATVPGFERYAYERYPVLFLDEYDEKDACALAEIDLIVVSGKEFPAAKSSNERLQKFLAHYVSHEGQHIYNSHQPGVLVYGRLQDEYSAVRSASEVAQKLWEGDKTEEGEGFVIFNLLRERAFGTLMKLDETKLNYVNEETIRELFGVPKEKFNYDDVYYDRVMFNADSDLFGIVLNYPIDGRLVEKTVWITVLEENPKILGEDQMEYNDRRSALDEKGMTLVAIGATRLPKRPEPAAPTPEEVKADAVKEREAREFIEGVSGFAEAIKPYQYLTDLYGYRPWKELYDANAAFRGGYLIQNAIPMLAKIFTRKELEKYWPDLVEIGKAVGFNAADLFYYALPGLVEAFGSKKIKEYWPDILRLGKESGRSAYYVLRFALPGLKDMITTREELNRIGGDLIELAKPAGNRSYFLLEDGIKAIKKTLTSEELKEYWPGLVEMGKAAGSSAGDLFNYGIPTLKDIFPAKQLKKYWPDLIKLAVAAGPGLAYLFAEVLPALGREYLETNWASVASGEMPLNEAAAVLRSEEYGEDFDLHFRIRDPENLARIAFLALKLFDDKRALRLRYLVYAGRYPEVKEMLETGEAAAPEIASLALAAREADIVSYATEFAFSSKRDLRKDNFGNLMPLRSLAPLSEKIEIRTVAKDELIKELAACGVERPEAALDEALARSGMTVMATAEGEVITPIVLDTVLSAYRGSREIDNARANYLTHAVTTVLYKYAKTGGEIASDGEAGERATGFTVAHEFDVNLMNLAGMTARSLDPAVSLAFFYGNRTGLPEYARKRTRDIYPYTAREHMAELMRYQLNERRAKQNIRQIFEWLSTGSLSAAQAALAIEELKKELGVLDPETGTCGLNKEYFDAVYGYMDERFFKELSDSYKAASDNKDLIKDLLNKAMSQTDVLVTRAVGETPEERSEHPWLETKIDLVDYLNNEEAILNGTPGYADLRTLRTPADLEAEPEAPPAAAPEARVLTLALPDGRAKELTLSSEMTRIWKALDEIKDELKREYPGREAEVEELMKEVGFTGGAMRALWYGGGYVSDLDMFMPPGAGGLVKDTVEGKIKAKLEEKTGLNVDILGHRKRFDRGMFDLKDFTMNKAVIFYDGTMLDADGTAVPALEAGVLKHNTVEARVDMERALRAVRIMMTIPGLQVDPETEKELIALYDAFYKEALVRAKSGMNGKAAFDGYEVTMGYREAMASFDRALSAMRKSYEEGKMTEEQYRAELARYEEMVKRYQIDKLVEFMTRAENSAAPVIPQEPEKALAAEAARGKLSPQVSGKTLEVLSDIAGSEEVFDFSIEELNAKAGEIGTRGEEDYESRLDVVMEYAGIARADLDKLTTTEMAEVPLERLTMTRAALRNPWAVLKLLLLGREGLKEFLDKNPPIIIKWGETYFISEGNHRSVAAWLIGENAIKAKVIEIKDAKAAETFEKNLRPFFEERGTPGIRDGEAAFVNWMRSVAAAKTAATEQIEAAKGAIGDFRWNVADWVITPMNAEAESQKMAVDAAAGRKFRKDYGSETFVRGYMYDAGYSRDAMRENFRRAFEKVLSEMADPKFEDMKRRAIAWVPDDLYDLAIEVLAEIAKGPAFEEKLKTLDPNILKGLIDRFTLIRESEMPANGIVDEVMHVVAGKGLLNAERYRKGDFGAGAQMEPEAKRRLVAFLKTLDPTLSDDPEVIDRILDGLRSMKIRPIDFTDIQEWKNAQDEVLRSL